MIQFDLPKEQSSIIKVIGVGGGGGNAVNHMFAQNIKGVDFIICNTDAQAVKLSNVPNKIQLGPALTEGLGAGANPEIGRQATEESLDEIKKILEVNTKMVFITAGMGGGTGTGGAPILAQVCKQMGILTVGIVTTPFSFEGKKRKAQAEKGIMELKEHVDTLLVISNDKVRHQYGNLKMTESFAKADNVLATAAKCITDVIYSTGQINVDFADVCTVMRNGGVAMLGSATAQGEDRALNAIETALNSPLLNDNDIHGASWILININSAEGDHEFTMDEVDQIQEYMLQKAGEDTDVIFGLGYDPTLDQSISVTLIATGFEHKNPFPKEEAKTEPKEEKLILNLEMPEQKPMPAKKVEQNTLPFADDKKVEETKMELTNHQKLEDAKVEAMMPKLSMEQPILNAVAENKIAQTAEEAPIFFEISSPADHSPVIDFNIEMAPRVPTATKAELPEQKVPEYKTPEYKAPERKQEENRGSNFLSKPIQVYAQVKPIVEETPQVQPVNFVKPEEKESMEPMKLILKEESPASYSSQNETMAMAKPKQEAVPDETEELRNRAMNRLARLRHLSFNINADDANSDYDTVPAYLRRNVELHNQIADVENFYSNYSVKNDNNPHPEINTINTFLDGKKPD